MADGVSQTSQVAYVSNAFAIRIQMHRLEGTRKLFLSCDCEIPPLAPNLMVHIQQNFPTCTYISTDL